MAIPDALNSLTDDEKKVLWYKCKKEFTHKKIAQVMGYQEDWVQLQMSRVYPKLDWQTKNIHWTVLEKRLREEVCPLIPQELAAFLSSSTGDTAENKPEEEPVEGVVVEEPLGVPSRGVVRGILIALAVLVVAVGAYWFLNRFHPGIPVAAALTPRATVVSSPLPTQQLPTSAPTAPIPPTAAPTATIPAPTDIPAPSSTAIPFTSTPDFFDSKVSVPFKDDIYVELQDLHEANYCSVARPAIVTMLVFHNVSSSGYMLRYNSEDFHATDDVGTEYKLAAVGETCDVGGLRNELKYEGGELWMYFSGTIPVNANYAIITIDNLNGIRFVFHAPL